MLHKRAGWRYAARAIIIDGLPELDDNYDNADATEDIRATAEFVKDMAAWLYQFSDRMNELKQSDEYREAVLASSLPSGYKKRNRARGSQ